MCRSRKSKRAVCELSPRCIMPFSSQVLHFSRESMAGKSQHDVTLLLRDWCQGDQGALDRLMPLVYEEIRRLAHRYMTREHAGHTLQTQAVTETWCFNLRTVESLKPPMNTDGRRYSSDHIRANRRASAGAS